MARRFFLGLLLLGLIFGIISPATHATETPDQPKNRGLYISPLRTYLTLNANESVTRAFTVANLTDRPMTVSTNIEQFSVADYTYDYHFDQVDNNWVQLVENSITLKPNESHEFAYKIAIPKNAAPGGHYYTLYASSTMSGAGTTTSTLRAATLLYLTVNGTLSRTSQVLNPSLPTVVIAPEVNYTIDIKNSGNIHYFAYIAARIDGLFYNDAPNGASQLLMPGTIRHVQQSIKSPLLPGVYKLSYSITPDQGNTVAGSRYFLFLPPWTIALLIIVITVIAHTVYRRVNHPKSE